MDDLDRRIVNLLQGGMAVSERPYAEAAGRLGIDEQTLIDRIGSLLERGLLTRFGPLYQAERLGGAFSLVAMQVPGEEVERVAEIVNGFDEVAHNYLRDHRFNIWYVLAVDDPAEIARVNAEIERRTGHRTYDMPKLEEFYVGLRLAV